MVNRPRPVGGEVLLVDQAEFEVRSGAAGVGRQRLFKGVDGALVILGGHSVFAREIIRVFLLIPADFAKGRPAGPARAEQNQSGPAPGRVRKRHAANLSELTLQRNDGLKQANSPSKSFREGFVDGRWCP